MNLVDPSNQLYSQKSKYLHLLSYVTQGSSLALAMLDLALGEGLQRIQLGSRCNNAGAYCLGSSGSAGVK